MPIIRLTEATWRGRELGRVRSILSHGLTREGMDQDGLARWLKRYLATEYTPAELLWFRDQLVEEGVIEVDEGSYAMASAASADVAAAPEQKKGIRWPWKKGKKGKKRKRGRLK